MEDTLILQTVIPVLTRVTALSQFVSLLQNIIWWKL